MKLPAYGRMLLEARRAGKHPERVIVIFGEDWKLDTPHPKLALKPVDYAPWRYDFRCCAGVPVDLVKRSEDGEKFLQLAGEIGRYAATVYLHTRAPGEDIVTAHEAAFCHRLQVGTWPSWWPEEIEKANGRNRQQWTAEALKYLARFAV